MTDIAIRVENLSKRYRIGIKEEVPDSLGGALAGWFKSPVANYRRLRSLSNFNENGGEPHPKSSHEPDDIIWALREISFDVQHGEVVGIIGHNGAGKSTLLKILTRITEPTSGKAIINGRVSSLLEVGTGFHPELSGRENIYLNGTVLGMSRVEIDQKFDEIVDFSGVERFIDTPVKRFSSGMQVRLAFAVAAHLEPEVLLIDEVLAVGDVEFQRRCLGKMKQVAGEGRTVLFVSHNMPAVMSLCSHAYVLIDGMIAFRGAPDRAVEHYYEVSKRTVDVQLSDRLDRTGSGELRFHRIRIADAEEKPLDALVTGHDICLYLDYRASSPVRNVSVSIGFNTSYGERILLCSNELSGQPFSDISPNGSFRCVIPKFPLGPGQYSLSIYATVNGIVADWVQDAKALSVYDGDYYGTGKTPPSSHNRFYAQHYWSNEDISGTMLT